MIEANNPKISVILVDGSYRSRLISVDALAEQSFPEQDYEILWVEFYNSITNELHQKEKNYPNFKTYTLNKTGIYHSSYCFNAGIQQAKGEVIVIPDADVLFKNNFLETVWQEHQKYEKLVMYVFRYDEPLRKQPANLSWKELETVCALTNPANYGGCLTVRKKWMLAVNGYEQHEIFKTGAHANGLDLATRFKNLGLHIMWHPELKTLHPWHPHKIWIIDPYRAQKTVIKHRALHQEIFPYQGIDPNLNRELPPALKKKINASKWDLSYYFLRTIKFIRRKIKNYWLGLKFSRKMS